MRVHLESDEESILLASRFGRIAPIARKVGKASLRVSGKAARATGRGARRAGSILRGRYGRLSPMAKARLKGAGAGLAIAGALQAARSYAKSTDKKRRRRRS